MLQPRANMCREWFLSRGEISIASLARGAHGGQALRPVREDRDVLQSKAVVAQANLVVALSRGSPVVRAAPRQRATIGSLEVLPHMSLALVLPKHLAVTVKLLLLNIS